MSYSPPDFVQDVAEVMVAKACPKCDYKPTCWGENREPDLATMANCVIDAVYEWGLIYD